MALKSKMILHRSVIVTAVFTVTACFQSNASDSKFYGEGGENLAASLDDVADAINGNKSGDFGIQSQMKLSNYYSEVIRYANSISSVTIGGVELKEPGKFFAANRDVIAAMNRRFPDVKSLRSAMGVQSGRKLSLSELRSSLQFIQSAMKNSKAPGVSSKQSRPASGYSRSNQNPSDVSQALALLDSPKDMNGGCTLEEVQHYREDLAKPLCESSKSGKEYLEKAGKAIGYAKTAATVAGTAASVLTPAAGVGAGAGAAVAAGASATGGALAVVGAVVGVVFARNEMNAKYYCPQVIGAAPIQHCECSNDDSCQGSLAGGS
jgi:hypothetical protein